MEALSNADRFVVLLRQKIAERANAKVASGKRPTAVTRTAKGSQRSITGAIAQAGADDRNVRRTIIEQILTDSLGAQIANEPRFQQIVERVAEIINADVDLGAMLAEVVAEIRR